MKREKNFIFLIVFLFFYVKSPLFSLPKYLSLRAGAKGAFTGSLWIAPTMDLNFQGDLPWDNTQFYIGGGGGVFLEANFYRYFSVSLECLYEKNSFMETVKINGSSYYKYDLFVHFTQLRVPLLLKGVIPTKIVEITFGIGPEFVFGLSSNLEFVTHNITINDTTKNNLYSVNQDDIFITENLELKFKIGKILIPFEIRAGYNLTQPKEYSDRVEIEYSETNPFVKTVKRLGVKASETVHFEVSLGVGYMF